MTKKDFDFISRVLKVVKPRTESEWVDYQWERTVLAFAASLIATNPRFDKERFLSACGWEDKGLEGH